MTSFGYIAAQSTQQYIQFIASQQAEGFLLKAMGKMVYFDTQIENKLYRAIGTVTAIQTGNEGFNNTMNGLLSAGHLDSQLQMHKDLRTSQFNIQAVFSKTEEESTWSQEGSYLPTSPSTRTPIRLLDAETVHDMLTGSGKVYPYIGTFRGSKDMYLPIDTPDFGGNRGAYHSGIFGKSGSGKTAGYTYILSTYMRHEQHAILVVDPQGQWSNENGFIFSPQNFARGLGRDVEIIRIAEEVRLPRDPVVLSRMADVLRAWSRMRRMGKENVEVFSYEVAERLCRDSSNFNKDTRTVLSEVFLSIAKSGYTMGRIYADDKARERLEDDLYVLAGEVPPSKYGTEDEETYMDEALHDVESLWESILKVFTPLLSLFSNENIDGERRHALSGESSVLSRIFQVRKEGGKPAPYVIIDMSPDQKNNARASMNQNDTRVQMKAILDNESVKALILQVLFQEIKKASETAFASQGGGTLNTQIVFDEAWRYAPEGKGSPEIVELAEMLEGFALDTRKFGIGWTYILQSPTDLKRGIWNQLTYVYAAYGLIGRDVDMLEERYSEKSQTNLYRGFISPAATGDYPMMIVGSISPLIFTNAPTFLDMFNSADDFLVANDSWVRDITKSNGLPMVTSAMVDPTRKTKKRASVSPDDVVTKSYSVGRTYNASTPQTAQSIPQSIPAPKELDEFDSPF